MFNVILSPQSQYYNNFFVYLAYKSKSSMGFLPIMQGIEAGATAGLGLYQLLRARQLQKNLGERPQYNFDYAQRGVEGLSNLAQGDLGLNRVTQGINQNYANTISNIGKTASSGASATAAAVQAGAGMQDAMNQAIQSTEMQRLGMFQNYLAGVQGLQGYANQAFQTNQLDPYLQKQQEISALKQSGLQNTFGVLSGGVNLAAQSALKQELQGLQNAGKDITEDELKLILAKYNLG